MLNINKVQTWHKLLDLIFLIWYRSSFGGKILFQSSAHLIAFATLVSIFATEWRNHLVCFIARIIRLLLMLGMLCHPSAVRLQLRRAVPELEIQLCIILQSNCFWSALVCATVVEITAVFRALAFLFPICTYSVKEGNQMNVFIEGNILLKTELLVTCSCFETWTHNEWKSCEK